MTTAWVFPGQGSQIVGMGRDLFQSVPAARAAFEEADALLDIAVTRLCFEGPENELTATENAQPALLTVCYALLQTIAATAAPHSAPAPAFVAGHSLGEYAALTAAGAFDFATALRLVRRRGQLMAAADNGTMAAIIGLPASELQQICAEVAAEGADYPTQSPVVIANYNAPDQLVISGTAAAVERVGQLARSHGAKRALPLKVSAAFHSPLMADAARAMDETLTTAAIHDLQIPLVANTSGLAITSAADVRRELVEQIAAPVQWVASIQQMAARGVSTIVEIGPGRILSGLIRRIAPTIECVNLSTIAEVHTYLAKSSA